MLGKISVKKPFTILVAVILVVVLGVVSFANTTTDLLPSMNMPYAVVMTTYPGATPEQVETEVTSPVESRMATVSGIDDVSSVSREHVSIVILKFTSSTDMDSASLEIREALDILELPEDASKPTIIKINPNMLPIMVSAVYVDGMSIDEVSTLTRDEIAPALEGVAGVASASTSGLIQKELHVVLSEDKISEVNKKLQDNVQKQLDKAKEEAIESQMKEYEDGKRAELQANGLPEEMIKAQLDVELPIVKEQVTAAVTEAMNNNEDTPKPEDVSIPSDSLNVETITDILKAQNFSVPAGVITDKDTEYMVRVGDKFDDTDEIKNMVMFDMGMEDVEPIKLSDVADVFETDNSDTQYTRVNGSPAVMISMQKQTEFSTADLTKDVLKKMDELSEEYEGLNFSVLMDQGDYIDIVVDAVLKNLLIGGILAIFILILFLKDLRPTLIVGISIPVSLLLAFTAMYFTGVSLNVISMSGLALAVGMLVDNSIVVIENIYRLRNDGVAAKRAAVEGSKQVAGAIIASTLTTISVFLPIAFLEGLTRQLFTDLALTIAYSLIASLLVALTVVPAASSGLFKKAKQKEHKGFNKFRDFYAKMLGGVLKVKWLVLILSVVLLGVSAWGVLQMGTEFIPSMDAPQISVTASVDEGTSFDDTVKTAEDLSKRIEEIDEVSEVGITVSSDSSSIMTLGSSGGTTINAYIILKDERKMKNEEIGELIREKTDDMDAEITVTGGASGDLNMLTGDAISINVEGMELDDIRDTAAEVADIVRTVEGTDNISDGNENPAPELRIKVDKDKAMEHGLTVGQVYMAVSGIIEEPEEKIDMNLSNHKYEVVIKDGDFTEPTRKEIEELTIKATNSDEDIKITDIAEIYEDTGFSSIRRVNQKRYVTVSGELKDGYNVGLVNTEIEKALSDYKPVDGCSITISGESEVINEAFGDLYLMLILAVIFIYLIMVAQFQSLLSPLIVMFTIPLAFTGGFIALMIAGMPMSVISMIGLIMLAGIVVNNGIVLVDYVNQLRKKGMAKKDAIVEAGRMRLRPIIMTAATTIVAMSIMMLGNGMGTEMAQPMAVTTVGGLIYATIMTLFVVPCMYDMFHKDKDMSHDEDLDYDKDEEQKMPEDTRFGKGKLKHGE